MIVCVYGTLTSGHRLHPALESSEFVGLGRLSTQYIMLQTSATFPAIVAVPTWYRAQLRGQAADAGYNLLPPLVEMYHVTSSDVLQHLDMIEGVPTLYQRSRAMLASTVISAEVDYSLPPVPDRTYTTEMRKYAAAIGHDRYSISASSLRETMVHVYTMPIDDEWLQGCQVIINGRFAEPQMEEGITWDYTTAVSDVRESRGGARPPNARTLYNSGITSYAAESTPDNTVVEDEF